MQINVPVPSGSANKNQGFAFITYEDPDCAVEAFQQADRVTFQGRMIHVIPGSAKRAQLLDDFTLSKLPLKEQNRLKKKAKAGSSFNWNSLYMNQDAVLTSTADRLGITKSELLDPSNADAAVKQALAETSTIQDTKAYFMAHGVNLDSFKSGQRSETVILVKNFPYGTSIEELRHEFQEYGQVIRVLMPPTGTIAVVHFANAAEAKTAFTKLAYRRFKNSILFLERGPKDLFVDAGNQVIPAAEPAAIQKLSAAELLEREDNDEPAESCSLFVKNLSFNTTTAQLHEAFKHLEGYRSSSVKTKADPKKPGQVLSMGFGFVSFSNKASAEAAAQFMDGHVLHAHKLVVRASHRGQDAAEQRRKDDAAKKAAAKSTKIIVKNLPFEATKKDIRTLMGTYGQLRTVRVPKNAQHRSKGYAFCEFVTNREAENAMAALKDTHLLGRKLVLEFAEAEAIDAEEEIAKMTKKTGSQNAKVSLHQLMGRDRKRITLGNEEDAEGEF
jgi:multiple RNA-binding domain-containing protein 1